MPCFMSKSLSHFEFNFVYGERVCSIFIDVHLTVWLSKHHLVKINTTWGFLFLYILASLVGD